MTSDQDAGLRRSAERVLAYLAAQGPLGRVVNSRGDFELKAADLRRLARTALKALDDEAAA